MDLVSEGGTHAPTWWKAISRARIVASLLLRPVRLPGQSNKFDDLVKQGWVRSGCYSFSWIFYLQTSRKIAGKLRAHSVEVVTD